MLRVLASGVDGLELSARGMVLLPVWARLERAKQEAREAGEAVPFEWPGMRQTFLMQPRGLHGQSYWLRSGDYELRLGRTPGGVPAFAQLHSAYLHARGPELAAGLVGTLLQVDVMGGPFELIGSRVDVYADVQGWEFELSDQERFVSRSRVRRAYLTGRDGSEQVFAVGRRVTMLRFGQDAVVARVYDKTREIGRRGLSWLPELWGERDESKPVWRVEFQMRRRALAEFHVREFDEVLASVQDFWDYATREWLTLRQRTANVQRTRWPLDPSWVQVQEVRIAPSRTGVVRRRMVEANEEMTLRGLQGSLSSWAALRGYDDLETATRALRPRVARYLKERKRSFGDEVRHKRARLLVLSGSEEASEDVEGEREAEQPPGGHEPNHDEREAARATVVRDEREAARATVVGVVDGGGSGTHPRGCEIEGSRAGGRSRRRGSDRGARSPDTARRARTLPSSRHARRGAKGGRSATVAGLGWWGGGGGTRQRTLPTRPSMTTGCLARSPDACATARPRSLTSRRTGGRSRDGD
jgi:hypothetical protein